MQRATAERLRNEWGETICQHLLLDREYKGGEQTGNLCCLICGRAFDEKQLLIVLYFPFLLAVCINGNSYAVLKGVCCGSESQTAS